MSQINPVTDRLTKDVFVFGLWAAVVLLSSQIIFLIDLGETTLNKGLASVELGILISLIVGIYCLNSIFLNKKASLFQFLTFFTIFVIGFFELWSFGLIFRNLFFYTYNTLFEIGNLKSLLFLILLIFNLKLMRDFFVHSKKNSYFNNDRSGSNTKILTLIIVLGLLNYFSLATLPINGIDFTDTVVINFLFGMSLLKIFLKPPSVISNKNI